MSHVTTISGIKITNIATFAKAMEFFDGKVEKASEFNYWDGRKSPCAHKVAFSDTRHELGLVESEGGFDVHFDAYTLGSKVGHQGELLKREYGLQAAIALAKKQGKRTTIQRTAQGAAVLNIHT